MKYVFALLILISFQAQARTYAEIQKYYSDNAYEITKKLCQIPKEVDSFLGYLNHHGNTADIAMYGLKSSVDMGEGAFKISPELSGLINSDGYDKALNECFNSNVDSKISYTARLIFLDTAGKAVGMFSMARVMTLATDALAKTSWAIKNPKKFTAILHVPDALALLALGFIGKEMYDKKSFENAISENPCILMGGLSSSQGEEVATLKVRAEKFLSKIVEIKNDVDASAEDKVFLEKLEIGRRSIIDVLSSYEKNAETNACKNKNSKLTTKMLNARKYSQLKAEFLNLKYEKDSLLRFIMVSKPKNKNVYSAYILGIQKNMIQVLQRLELTGHISVEEIRILQEAI